MSAESIRQELEVEAKEYKDKFLDVAEMGWFLQQRARKWAEYRIAENFTDHDWRYLLINLLLSDKEKQQKWLEDFAVPIRNDLFNKERWLIWTNTPHAHEALFIEEVISHYIDKARERGYLGDVGGTKFTEEGLRLLQMESFYGSDKLPLPSVNFPDYTSIHALADKDKELFPDPEPIRIEKAGAIINFTTWDAALVVYVDCAYQGKRLYFHIDDRHISSEVVKTNRNVANIVERTDGNASICAAVFPRIPFVTDYHRRDSKIVTRVDCTVYYSDYPKPDYSENVTLFRGQVNEIDWRGRLPQLEPQPQPITKLEPEQPQPTTKPEPQPQPTTTSATPSHRATRSEHTVKLFRYDVRYKFRLDRGYSFYNDDLKEDAIQEAETYVETTYPGIFQTRQEVEDYARRRCEQRLQWQDKSSSVGSFETNDPELYRTVFVTHFVNGCIKEVEKRGGRIQQSTTAQATPATSPTGATVIVKRVDRSRPNELVYYLELVDPGYIEGSYEPKPLTVYFEGATVPDTTTSTTSSTGSARGFAGGEAIAGYSIPMPQPTSGTSQRPRKPKGSYWGKT